MKKGDSIIVITVILLIILAGLVFKPTGSRSNEKLERLANVRYLEKIDNPKIRVNIKDFNKLPPIDMQDQGMFFSWYYILETGDSAILNIQVNRRGKLLQDEQFRVTMNRKWGYLFTPNSEFINVLPLKHAGDSVFLERVALIDIQDDHLNPTDSLHLLIPKKKLFYFLKEGYFNVLERYEDNTVVAFYEPVATIIREGKSKQILTAKIFFNESSEVLILPYDVPKELWDNYNKE